jgi:hypothetical protein
MYVVLILLLSVDQLNALKRTDKSSPRYAEDARLANLRAKVDELGTDVANSSDAVRAKKRLIQVTLNQELRSKTHQLSTKNDNVAKLRATIEKRERTATSIARDLVSANTELQQWVRRRQGLVWLEQWLAAKDSHATIAIKTDVPRLQDLLEQVAAELGEKSALAIRLKDQVSRCHELQMVISCSKPSSDD